MPFNHNFAQDLEENLISTVQKSRGCFNVNCNETSASKRCTRCQLAVYCSHECQLADWNFEKCPHKKICKIYRDNVAPDTRPEGNGQKGSVPIGLLSVEMIDEEHFSKAMKERADLFLKEAKRCLDIDLKNDKFGFRKATIGLAAAVVYNLGKPRLQCAATIHDSDGEIGFGQGMATVNHIIFDAVGDGGEEVQKRLHPVQGPGDISQKSRERVVELLRSFFHRARRYSISIQSVTFGRGLMWMKEIDFRDDKTDLEEANGGDLIIWMPDMQYDVKPYI